ncbi:MAG: hypothetical protein MJ180_00140 [Candidatus Gastranaerophilales bacterium]|nr:hypothetical protein [Candidatus Gastranaerophilales bacterium]
MQISIIDGTSFGYKSVLKTEFKNGNLPTVKIDPMGSLLTKENVTLDHYIPHSKGGKSNLTNYLLMKNTNNWNKGNLPPSAIPPNGLAEYLKQFIGVQTKSFDGDGYARQISKTASTVYANWKEIIKGVFK